MPAVRRCVSALVPSLAAGETPQFHALAPTLTAATARDPAGADLVWTAVRVPRLVARSRTLRSGAPHETDGSESCVFRRFLGRIRHC